ncbi:MAG TPA: hypothetical protein VGW36_09445 [Pyrinomonadaceae bacterium]|nr:hypothetical protein [Pyrinomonadaceae bacterium]
MIYPTLRKSAVLLVLSFSLCATALAQDKPDKPTPENVAQAEAVIKRGIEAYGGSNYLNMKTVVGRGFYTTFQDGMSQIPARFIDYIAYPDRERTEFTGNGIRVIQTNSGDTGWLYDGGPKTISDMKPSQIEDFKRGMRNSFENLLHGWWKKEGATLAYVGRREAGLAKRNEVVRLTYPDGYWIEFEFAARDGLPAKIIYKRTRKRADSEETEQVTEEDRLAKPITIAGITAPWVIDHYIEGTQTSRINYESIEYNQPLPDSLFAKPANIKALK